jgi:hypothetical protein
MQDDRFAPGDGPSGKESYGQSFQDGAVTMLMHVGVVQGKSGRHVLNGISSVPLLRKIGPPGLVEGTLITFS